MCRIDTRGTLLSCPAFTAIVYSVRLYNPFGRIGLVAEVLTRIHMTSTTSDLCHARGAKRAESKWAEFEGVCIFALAVVVMFCEMAVHVLSIALCTALTGIHLPGAIEGGHAFHA